MEKQKSPIRAGSFTLWDYGVFSLMLAVSAVIGVYYACSQAGRQSSGEFLVAGRSMTAAPVALSLAASFMSAVTVLGTPVEVYCYGASYVLICLSVTLTAALTSELFLPIFYRLGITSSYEYLEMRFNKATRVFGTVLFILQTLLYTGLVIYAPALALNQVTGIDLWGAVISTGAVCTFYCTLGGLKAVVWTDVFQAIVIVVGLLAVIIQSVLLQGGVSVILNDSAHGGRLHLWDFDPNPLRRHTFWTIVIGGTFTWTSIYGINPAQVQRYVSCRSLLHAKISLYVSMVCLWVILLCSVFCGLCLYSIYKTCDPFTAKKVSDQNQLMPYLVVDILRDYRGLPGLFVAAAYCGTLSTVSSSVNALAAVTISDLISPYFSFSEQQLSWASKGVSILYGAMCMGMAGLTSLMGGLLQAAIGIIGATGGPLLGLFTLGILFPSANSSGGMVGLVCGLTMSLWVYIGAQIYPPLPERTRPLTLETHGCNFSMDENILLNWTTYTTEASRVTIVQETKTLDRPLLAEMWYSLSYMYLCMMGTLTVIVVGLIVSFLSGERTQKREPGLTVLKEDLTCFKIFRVLKLMVTGNAAKIDLSGRKEKKLGKTNLAFCDVELDITKIQPRGSPSKQH